MKTKRFHDKNRIALRAAWLLTLLGLLSLSAAAMSARPALIGEDAAKAAALAHAGLESANVTFVKVELDKENGVQVYEVEFYDKNGREYDYEINAVTGEVVSVDNDAENYPLPTDAISREKAISIALAKVPGAKNADIKKAELDYEDGRWVYEVEILYGGSEYEGEIDAHTGEVIKWETERD